MSAEVSKTVVGHSVVDMECSDSLTGLKLMAHQDVIAAADSLLVRCVWQLISDRLSRLGQLDKLLNVVAPKNGSVSLVGGPPAIR